MLDNYYIRNNKNSYVETTIHEIRAPTDASVKLLKEMEQAAKDKLVDSFILKGNSLNGVVSIYREVMRDQLIIEITFDLNGKRINEIVRIHSDEKNIIDIVKNTVAKRIATELLIDTFTKLDDHTIKLFFK